MQGIYEVDTGSFVNVRSRSDLSRHDVQSLLARNHRTRNLSCGCGIEEDRINILEARLLGDGRYTIVRDDVRDHAPTCFLHREGDDAPTETLRSAGIFSAPCPPILKNNPAPSNHEEWSKRHYDTFFEYARRVFSHGLANAFFKHNCQRKQYSNPSLENCFIGIDDAIRGILFEDGACGYAVAERNGLTLRFGLIFSELVDGGLPVSVVPAYWWDGRGFSAAIAPLHPTSIEAAVSQLVIFERHRAPPYFVLAVQDADGLLSRVYLHQVLVRDRYLIPVDSTAEAAAAEEILQKGGALLKPVKMEDSVRVLDQLGHGLPSGQTWHYRPDFLIFWKAGLYIRELRGFRRGQDPQYDELLDRKRRHYIGLFPRRTDAYREIDGTGTTIGPKVETPENWPWPIELEAIPPSLFG